MWCLRGYYSKMALGTVKKAIFDFGTNAKLIYATSLAPVVERIILSTAGIGRYAADKMCPRISL